MKVGKEHKTQQVTKSSSSSLVAFARKEQQLPIDSKGGGEVEQQGCNKS